MNTADERNVITVEAQRTQFSAGDQAGNLGKVRDILFGSQMREYEKRFVRLEERLTKTATELKDELRRRFDALEIYVKNEVALLIDQVKGEQGQRAEAVGGLARELKDTSNTLERKIAQLDEQTTKNQRDLRQQILEQSKNLSNDLQQRYEEISTALEQAVRELRTDKTDRNTLADLFTEIAMRLNNEFTIPDE
jgi:gas vesicle protein